MIRITRRRSVIIPPNARHHGAHITRRYDRIGPIRTHNINIAFRVPDSQFHTMCLLVNFGGDNIPALELLLLGITEVRDTEVEHDGAHGRGRDGDAGPRSGAETSSSAATAVALSIISCIGIGDDGRNDGYGRGGGYSGGGWRCTRLLRKRNGRWLGRRKRFRGRATGTGHGTSRRSVRWCRSDRCQSRCQARSGFIRRGQLTTRR
mmetsp:Transcript_26714/g.43406  ORF Transcript_26714/g.43406 Transcript_26714/m.43406 type:complete len:206 (-) Transcript_26714:100-717(-)